MCMLLLGMRALPLRPTCQLLLPLLISVLPNNMLVPVLAMRGVPLIAIQHVVPIRPASLALFVPLPTTQC